MARRWSTNHRRSAVSRPLRNSARTLSVYYRDPDGNRMEFQVDCCANADEAHTYMRREAFAANPAGVDIDAEALMSQYRSGATAEQLLAMPAGPPTQIPPEHGLI